MIDLGRVLSRVRRLDELARALARESRLIGEGNDPLLYLGGWRTREPSMTPSRGCRTRVVPARAGQRIRGDWRRARRGLPGRDVTIRRG